MYKQLSKDLLQFLKDSPTAFHAVENMRQILKENGYEELLESQSWNLEKGHKYYVTRNDSSIIAFHIGNELTNHSYNIIAAHSDSPTYKVKENCEMNVRNKYLKLNTEGYGGVIDSTWLDRPLSLAGRVLVKEGDSFVSKLLKINRDLLLIPNVAIHLNREVNNGYAFNKQVDLLPLFAGKDAKPGAFLQLLADELNVNVEDIYGHDLFLYNRQEPSIWGLNEEFISSQHIDDLQCAYSGLRALLQGNHKDSINVLAIFDNEEVGSLTKQGADSTFLFDTMKRINSGLHFTEEEYYRSIASSFMLSADNGHAVHPNHPELTDETNCCYLNEGVVIKAHAGQKYCSDGVSIAIFKNFAKNANVPVQYFMNRSDKQGGSTLGNLSQAHVSLNSIDIGLAQLAMHSSYETVGIKDTYYMIEVMKEFYQSHIEETALHTLKVSK